MKWLWLILVCTLGFGNPVLGQDTDAPEYARPKWWWVFIGPSKDTPQEQFSFAQRLEQKQEFKHAARAYRYLATYWPESREAPIGLRRAAQLEQEREKWSKAFELYQKLLQQYSGQVDYASILEEQQRIAKAIEDDPTGDVLFLPGYEDREKAIPYYAQIITNAPNWEKAAEIKYTMGQIYEAQKKYTDAIAVYAQITARFPESPFADEAAFQQAFCLHKISNIENTNLAATENAWAAYSFYLNEFEDGRHREKAFENRQQLHRKLARMHWEKAQYYDTIEKKPAAALIAYEVFIEQFPASEFADEAKQRMAQLQKEPATSP